MPRLFLGALPNRPEAPCCRRAWKMTQWGRMQRLDQLLASLGYGSRREVRTLVEQGRVSAAGRVQDDHGAHVDPAGVLLDGQPLDHPGEILLLMHKPLGRVCSHDEGQGPTVYGLLPPRWQRRNPRIATVGRLDKETSGLLLLTDSSGLIHRLTSPRHKVPKVYRARLDREPPAEAEGVFESGTLRLTGEEKPCAPALLARRSALEVEVTLTEGRFHQVRRMLAAVGCTVLELHRTRFGSLELGAVEPGKYIELPINYFDK